MSILLLDDEMVHYEVLGRGRPVIFLHGWVGSWRYWIPSMQALSVSYRAYAVDLWGFGGTSKNPARYALEEQLQLVEQFIDRMGIVKTALVGHGLGAVVGLLVALHRPEMVDRLMAITTPLTGDSISPRLGQSPQAELSGWLLDHSLAAGLVDAEASKADLLAIRTSLDQLVQLNVLRLVQQLSLPNIWVHGDLDPAVKCPDEAALASLGRQSHFILFEGSGHYPMLDEPVKFHRLLADYLSLEAGDGLKQLQLKEKWKRRVR